jgi:glyceraldehyde-3-phosphate dehydrogenase (NADP+)
MLSLTLAAPLHCVVSCRAVLCSAQINSAPARGPDHFPFQGFRDSGIGSQGIKNSLSMMTKIKSTVINLDKESYTQG